MPDRKRHARPLSASLRNLIWRRTGTVGA